MRETEFVFNMNARYFIGAVVVIAQLLPACGSRPATFQGRVEHESPPRRPIPLHRILELSFRYHNTLKNPFFDAVVETEFISPDGRSLLRKGFYHSAEMWAVRFRPDRAREWRYR